MFQLCNHCVSLHIICNHLKMPCTVILYGRKLSIYSKQSWELWKGYTYNKHLNVLYILVIIIHSVITTEHIQPAHPRYCAFLLLNTAKCSALPQLFHEIQPYGFDMNGKCDCRPFALQSIPASLLVLKYARQWWNLLQSLLIPANFPSWGSLTRA